MENLERERSESDSEPKIDGEPVQTSQAEIQVRSARGPRTPRGKEQSKMNASKHGIFTAGILEGLERKVDHDKLVGELRDHFQPEGTFEELLVEKLAMLCRRHRRLLIAESAEILKERSDRRLQREALELEDRVNSNKSERGLTEFLTNPFVVERCIKLLTDWRGRIHQRGYDAYWDFNVTRILYGRFRAEELDASTQREVKEMFANSGLKNRDIRSDQEKQEFESKEYTTLLSQLDKHIELLQLVKSTSESISAELTQYERDSQLVPRAENLDRLIRYEAHIDRSFDRTLNQLERSIRMRLGHPSPPVLNIDMGQ